ncbi:MAG: topoisomerase [Chloroflexota bacterium]
MEAYCVKCKGKREMAEPTAVFTKQAVCGTKGRCAVCGTGVYRMGRTPAHDGLVPPVAVPRAGAKRVVRRRVGKLVIVESPAKARTIGKFLGKGYSVKASLGHVRDLLRSQLSVDVTNNFTPKYRIMSDRLALVKELRQDAAAAAEIYLATDLDREGEAIAWHLGEALKVEPERVRRVVFHEITKTAIKNAFENPREINSNLIDAQQARRILDRLVGYSLSPLLWAKIRGRLSAGRVQSVAVRLVVDREREIDQFEPVEYWTLHAELSKLAETSEKIFSAALHTIGGQRVGRDKDVPLDTQAALEPVLKDLEHAAWSVSNVKRGERKRNPAPPFTTSTLQQDASRRLGYTARRTMAVAQSLYEGVDLAGNGSVGLITYMRTDSLNVAAEAQAEVRELVTERYGADSLPATAPMYKTKAKGAQEAHEAIRPTSAMRTPEQVQADLTRDQFRLYQLIWRRLVASQMLPAIYETVAAEIDAAAQNQNYGFRASGSLLRFPGFLQVYEETVDEDAQTEEDETEVPPLETGDALQLQKLLPEQHFTQPPPRFTEASLIKVLEENGIGRPSTYAPTITTIQARGYVLSESRRLMPTAIGIQVTDMLMEHFSDVLDVSFTKKMEEELDAIAEGERQWVPVIGEFYGPFAKQVERAQAEIEVVPQVPEYVDKDCPKCSQRLLVRYGRYGKFVACSGFPDCRHVEPLLEKIGVPCPTCTADLVERRTRKGRSFFGCIKYPECEWTSWKRPLSTPCPDCKGMLVQSSKTKSTCLECKAVALLQISEAVA